MMTTPSRITSDIRKLCRKFGTADDPVFVAVTPRADSLHGDCFVDVDRQVSEHGGSSQHGWLIWEWPGVMVEGEFHAVWRAEDSTLVDVTVKQDGETRILFAPDRERRFAERRVFTVRHAIANDPRVAEFISTAERFERLSDERFRDRFGERVVMGPDLVALRMRMQLLGQQISQARYARRAVERSSYRRHDAR